MSVLDTAPLTLVLDDNFFLLYSLELCGGLGSEHPCRARWSEYGSPLSDSISPATGLKGGFVFDPNGAFIL